MNLLEQIFKAGIVGAGGAGFPTHKKLTDQAHTLVVNAAECEPLLASDRYVMRSYANEIIEALAALQDGFGFKRIIIGLKQKYSREIAALEAAISKIGRQIEIHGVSSFYPAGDEQTLIYEITGETVPPGGIPLALGIVVINVTTAYQIRLAMKDIAMTRRYVTVTGQVDRPVLVDAPVGTSFEDCIAAAGDTALTDYTIIKGGPMMGKQFAKEEGLHQAIGKADGGLIVLDSSHPLIEFSNKPIKHMINQAKSVCIQCSYCTEMCPRYLIGHQMRPHRVMRCMGTGAQAQDLKDALLCCECGICELYACPMQLSPRRMNMYVKMQLRQAGDTQVDKNIYQDHSELRSYRKIAQSRFINRLCLTEFPTDLDDVVVCRPRQVKISTRQGIGKASEPTVKVGDSVKVGDVIASLDFQDMGSLIHASIDGTVVEADSRNITIKAKGETG